MWKITTLTWFCEVKKSIFASLFPFGCKNVDLPFFSRLTQIHSCTSPAALRMDDDGRQDTFHVFIHSWHHEWGNGIYVYMLLKYKCSLRINFAILQCNLSPTHIYIRGDAERAQQQHHDGEWKTTASLFFTFLELFFLLFIEVWLCDCLYVLWWGEGKNVKFSSTESCRSVFSDDYFSHVRRSLLALLHET